LEKGEAATHFNLIATALKEHDLLDKPNSVNNMEESGFSLKIAHRKLLPQKKNWRLFR
jgi:hypothetical protein